MEAQQYLHALQEAGLTQAQIAERTGVPQPTISKVMRGEVKDVMSRNYRRIQELHAEVLGAAVGKPVEANTQETRDAA